MCTPDFHTYSGIWDQICHFLKYNPSVGSSGGHRRNVAVVGKSVYVSVCPSHFLFNFSAYILYSVLFPGSLKGQAERNSSTDAMLEFAVKNIYGKVERIRTGFILGCFFDSCYDISSPF